MKWKKYIRRIFFATIGFILIYFIIFRRRSSQVFLTASHVQEFLGEKIPETSHLHRIPRIIHQTWKTEHVPLHWNNTVTSVQQFNAEKFEYRLWTDEDMHKFVRQVEPDIYHNTFLTYSLDIQRVDAFRYIVLYHQGGLYIDMDNGCRQSFESLLDVLEIIDKNAVHLAAFPRTSPVGISNGFMIATKGHPFFKILMSRLSLFNHNYLIDYLTVMLSAGPIYLSINEFYFDKSSTQSAIRILDEVVYSGIYTWHTPGNSWHGKDARIILYFYHSIRSVSSKSFYQCLFILCLVILLIFYRCYFRQYKMKYKNIR
jgi:mannosyltransferase OCH1-like enzyme